MGDMKLSVRIEKSKSLKGQARHDFFERPTYADSERLHLNKTIFGGSYADIEAVMKKQSENIIKQYNEKAQKMRDAVDSAAEKRKIPSWRKTTATHKTAIITFDREFHKNQDRINRDDLDECASNFLADFCEKNNCELSYIVRHDDEATAHYHATFTNIDMKSLKVLRFEKKDTSALQDLAGKHFKKMGITRGVKVSKKLEIARLNNPRLEGESNKDYEKRIYKLAGVIHRTVKELHEDLPVELANKQAELDSLNIKLSNQEEFFKERVSELEDRVSLFQTKIAKVTKNIDVAEAKLKSTNDKDVVVTNKIEKNISIYNRRFENLNNELEASQAELEKIKALVSDEKEKLDELRKKPLRLDIARSYEVVTSKGLIGKETEKRSLVNPVKYQSAIKQLMEKQKFNDKRSVSLNKKDNRLKVFEKELNRKASTIDEQVKKGVQNTINSSVEEIARRVRERARIALSDVFIEVATYDEQIKLTDENIAKFQDKINLEIDREVDDLDFSM